MPFMFVDGATHNVLSGDYAAPEDAARAYKEKFGDWPDSVDPENAEVMLFAGACEICGKPLFYRDPSGQFFEGVGGVVWCHAHGAAHDDLHPTGKP